MHRQWQWSAKSAVGTIGSTKTIASSHWALERISESRKGGLTSEFDPDRVSDRHGSGIQLGHRSGTTVVSDGTGRTGAAVPPAPPPEEIFVSRRR